MQQHWGELWRNPFILLKYPTMAKELPYFQFEPAAYLTGNVSFCSLAAQGLFTNLCSYYWQRSCELTKEQFLRRINAPNELQELIDEGVISIEDNYIKISFLDQQFENAINKSNINSSNGSKGGRPKKINPIKTEIKANENPNESETKGIRKEEIKKEEKKEENKILKKESVNDFLFWFNSAKEKITGKQGNFKMLSKTDENNLNRLLQSYTYEDFNQALPKMFANKWAVENNMLTPTHFLRNDNFNKYLNTEININKLIKENEKSRQLQEANEFVKQRYSGK